jgi:hypothetical protein
MVNVAQYIKLDLMKQMQPADIQLWQQVCSAAPTEQGALWIRRGTLALAARLRLC